VKGLDGYTTVADRIARFTADWPAGRIHTDPVELGPDRYLIRALVWRTANPDAPPDAIDFAQEYATSDRRDGPNGQGFALENCCTSAVGRALGLLGYGNSDGTRASREEMEAAERRRLAAELNEHHATAVFQQLARLKGTPYTKDAAELGKRNDRKLSMAALVADPEWREVVAEWLVPVLARLDQDTAAEQVVPA
jgi:hypothetical protein